MGQKLGWETFVSCYKVYLVVLPPNQIFLPMLITFKKTLLGLHRLNLGMNGVGFFCLVEFWFCVFY